MEKKSARPVGVVTVNGIVRKACCPLCNKQINLPPGQVSGDQKARLDAAFEEHMKQFHGGDRHE